MRNPLLAGVCLAAVLVQLSLAQTSPYTGVVKAEGQPIPGATVKATQGDRILLTITDENGAFKVDGMTAGQWNVEVSMFGFDVARKEVTVAAAGAKTDFTLQLRERARAFDRNQAQVESTDGAAIPPPDPTPVSSDSANESLMVTGSISQGLQTTAGEMRDFDGGPGGRGFGPGGFGPGGFGEGGIPGAAGGDGAGLGGRGGPGGPGGRGAGGPGGRGGPGGPGGAPGGGGFAGGGPGGRGGGGAPGGGGGGRGGGPGGGPGAGRGGAAGGRAGNAAFIGNRSRRGADQIRTQVFYTFRNSALDARPFALNGIESNKAAYAQNRFGFNIGGPMIIPHLFDDSNKGNFFINYSGNLVRNGYDQLATLPVPAVRGGDFSSINSVIYDPTNGQPFAGNRIPTERLNPIALGLLKFVPLPNQTGAVGGIQNYRFLTSVPSNNQSLNTRYNRTLTKKDRLAITFNYQNRNGLNAQVYGFRDESSGRGTNGNVTWSHTLGPRSFQNLVLSFNRNRSQTIPFFAFGDNVAAQLGIQGASPDPRNFGPPNLSFTNYGGLNDGSPLTSATQSMGIADNVSFHRGKHNFNVGGDYRRYLTNSITDANGRGTFTFTGLTTSALDAGGRPLANTGWDFADFLLGLPQSKSIRFGSSSQYFRNISYSAFANDDFRVSANLSLNLGLRYEYFSPLREKYGHIANLDIAPGFTAVANVVAGGVGPFSGSFSDALINPDRNNFSPRFGFAWKPRVKGKTVIRGGYGWYYNQGVYNQFARQLAAQPPFATTSQVQTSTLNPLTLATGLTVTPTGKTITNTFAVDRFYRAAYAQSWNLSIQGEQRGLVLEVSYSGTKGTRLDIQRAPNRAANGSPLTAEQRLAIGNATGFTFDSPDGNSILHSGTFRVTRRMRAGFAGSMSYTWAKSIDNSSTFGGAGNTVAQNDRDLAAERGLSSFDRRHSVSANFNFASPVGGKSGLLSNHKFLEKSLKDWNLSSAITAQTGSPFTARVLGNVSDPGGTGALGSGRANATGLPVDSGNGFFNPAAFTIPTAGFGNAGRNTIPGPGLWAINLSLARTVRLAERKSVEFRVDAQNFLNHVNISGFGTVVNSLTYGVPTAAGQMRSLTATLRFRM